MKAAFPSTPPTGDGTATAAELLDQAIAWAVRLGSGSADEKTHDECGAWRAAHPSHEQAWQQVQAVEDTFRQVPRMGEAGGALAHGALQAATRLRAQQGRRLFVEEFERTMEDEGLAALLAPTTLDVAPPLSGDHYAQRPILLSAVRPLSQTGGPVISIPAGTGDDGLPVGVQLAGRRGDEAALLQLAASL